MGQMTGFKRNTIVYTLHQEGLYPSAKCVLSMAEEARKHKDMTHHEDNKQELPRSNLARSGTAASWFLAIISLLNIGILYSVASPVIFLTGLGCSAPLLQVGGVIAGFVGLFHPHASTGTRWLASLGILLSALSLVLYILWFGYSNAVCQQNPGGCT